MGKRLTRLIEIRQNDVECYQQLSEFLPEKIFDVHAHIWRLSDYQKSMNPDSRFVSWPLRVASENPIEHLIETYKVLLPDKSVIPLMFPNIPSGNNLDNINDYAEICSKKTGYPSLIFSSPYWSAEDLERRVQKGGFLGAKSYMSMLPENIPANSIRIFDYFPRHQLEIHDKHGWIVMLHIPKDGRLKDPENLKDLLEIDERYQNIQLIVAHVGRAYCDEDAGNAFEILKKTKRIMFDISANTNENIFFRLIDCVAPDRILFGSDMPITRMRMKRITKNAVYVNLVPAGLYGDVSGDKHMQEVKGKDAEKLTFFLYEEIFAFKRACERHSLGKNEIKKIFCDNAERIIKKARNKQKERYD